MARVAPLGAVLATVFAVAGPAAAAPGNLDNGFGSGGVTVVTLGDGGGSMANGIAPAPNGELVTGGEAIEAGTFRFALGRFGPDGNLLGATLTPVGPSSGANAIAVDGAGRPVLAGSVAGMGTLFGWARYDSGGTLDTGGFGSGGVQGAAVGNGGDAVAHAVALQGDGRIVAAGRALDGGQQRFGLARLTDGGAPDSGSFGATGTVVVPVGDGGESTANAVAVQPNGSIVAAGSARDGGSTKIALVRRLANGDPDGGFGAGGTALTDAGDGRDASANGLALLPDGSMLVAGSARDGDRVKLLLARYTPNGQPDGAFGTGGQTLLEVGDEAVATALAIDVDGRIVVAGHTSGADGTSLLVARFDLNGTPDASFGTGGVAITPLGDSGLAEANGLALQGDRVVVAGWTEDAGAGKTVLARYVLRDPVSPPPPGGGEVIVPPPVDGLAPTLSARLTNRIFRVGRGRGVFAAGRRRAPVGTTIRYTLSEAARVTIRVQRKARGVRVRGRCLRPSPRRRGRRCTRWINRGKPLVRESPAGTTSIRWSGRLGRRALSPATYRLVFRARDAAGNNARIRTVGFRVVRR